MNRLYRRTRVPRSSGCGRITADPRDRAALRARRHLPLSWRTPGRRLRHEILLRRDLAGGGRAAAKRVGETIVRAARPQRFRLRRVGRPGGEVNELKRRRHPATGVGEGLAIVGKRPEQRFAPQGRLAPLDHRVGLAHAAEVAQQIERFAIGDGNRFGIHHRQREPDRCSKAPASRTSAKGATRGLSPPSTASSASASDWRNSFSVSPPSITASSRPSGFSARRSWVSAPGRSLTQCSASRLVTRSKRRARTAALPRRRHGEAGRAAAPSGRQVGLHQGAMPPPPSQVGPARRRDSRGQGPRKPPSDVVEPVGRRSPTSRKRKSW